MSIAQEPSGTAHASLGRCYFPFEATPLGAPTLTINLVGPGGAGKSTTGALVAAKRGCQFEDLDEYFLQNTGNIGDYIDENGYDDYARQNVGNYLTIKQSLHGDAVIALSSGFMLYPDAVHPLYVASRQELEHSPSTFVLMAGFDQETCVRTTIKRQLSKPHHNGNAEAEELSIRKRFPFYMALRCRKLNTLKSPEHVASKILEMLPVRNVVSVTIDDEKGTLVTSQSSGNGGQ